jgi:hypothetical protein
MTLVNDAKVDAQEFLGWCRKGQSEGFAPMGGYGQTKPQYVNWTRMP